MNNREQVETTSVVSQVQGISFESSDNNQAATPLDNHYSISIADELRKLANLRTKEY